MFVPKVANSSVSHSELVPDFHAFGASAISQSDVPPTLSSTREASSVVTWNVNRLFSLDIKQAWKRLTFGSIRISCFRFIEQLFYFRFEVRCILEIVILSFLIVNHCFIAGAGWVEVFDVDIGECEVINAENRRAHIDGWERRWWWVRRHLRCSLQKLIEISRIECIGRLFRALRRLLCSCWVLRFTSRWWERGPHAATRLYEKRWLSRERNDLIIVGRQHINLLLTCFRCFVHRVPLVRLIVVKKKLNVAIFSVVLDEIFITTFMW